MSETPSNYGYAATGRISRMCLRCGLVVGDTDVHDAWHKELNGVLVSVQDAVLTLAAPHLGD